MIQICIERISEHFGITSPTLEEIKHTVIDSDIEISTQESTRLGLISVRNPDATHIYLCNASNVFVSTSYAACPPCMADNSFSDFKVVAGAG